jgi:hypothetical protein
MKPLERGTTMTKPAADTTKDLKKKPSAEAIMDRFERSCKRRAMDRFIADEVERMRLAERHHIADWIENSEDFGSWERALVESIAKAIHNGKHSRGSKT